MTNIQALAQNITRNIGKVIIGKEDAIELLLVALICEGHILLDDVPGVGKTMLARAMAITIGGKFRRLQCTPDLLPNDITGVSIFNQSSMEFEFRPGPVFVNILLADEINRATPRTQAALLEAMQEQQVTVDGNTYPLPRPFIVMATQNPVEFEGTFPLPEAQLDRFMMQISLGYPTLAEEKQILINLKEEHPINTIASSVEISEISDLRQAVWSVHVDETIQNYILSLVSATRKNPDITLGASPRASLALYKGAQALAALRGRDHTIPDDIKHLYVPTIAHRIMVKPESALRGKNAVTLVKDILTATPVPLQTP